MAVPSLEEKVTYPLVDDHHARTVSPSQLAVTVLRSDPLSQGSHFVDVEVSGLRGADQKGLVTDEIRKDPATRDPRLLEAAQGIFAKVAEAAKSAGVAEGNIQSEPLLHGSVGRIRVHFQENDTGADNFMSTAALVVKGEDAALRAQADSIREERNAMARDRIAGTRKPIAPAEVRTAVAGAGEQVR
jgi:hypothetical protein